MQNTPIVAAQGASLEEFVRADLRAKPYEVYHPEGDTLPPTFATWGEALAAQVRWNKECPGHVARRRRLVGN